MTAEIKEPQQVEPFLPWQRALIALALLAGAALRLLGNSMPFHSSDHAELAAIVTFFYPRGLDSLGFSSGSTWTLLTSAHGVLPPLIGLVSSTLLGVLGVHLNELWWNLPFVLLHLLTIPLAALLVRRLAGRGAGTLAAALLALLPIHAALSRASGLSHIPLTAACQLLTVFCFVRYFRDPSPRRTRQAALALMLNLLVELFFPLLFILLLGVGVLTVETRQASLGARLAKTRALLFRPRVMLPGLLVLGFNFTVLILNTRGIGQGGVAARLFSGSDRRPGIYLGDFLSNASYVVGALALALLALAALAGLPRLRRLEQSAVPVFWGLLYLLPFLLFTRPHVYEYFLLGTMPLALNAAIVAARLWRERRWPRGLAASGAAVLLALFLLRSISMIFGRDLLPLAGTGRAPGGIFADQGLKAAAWYVRTHSNLDERVFADTLFEQYQVFYYLQRPALAVNDAADPEEAYRLLDAASPPPAFYLVLPGNEELLRRHTPPGAAPVLAARVVDGPTTLLLVYQQASVVAVETLDVRTANAAFERDYGPWRAAFALD